MNTAKLAYKGPHDRNFPDHLKLSYKIITQNLRKKFKENTIELEKRITFESEYAKVLNKLPNDFHSEKSSSWFKDKSFKFLYGKAVARTICLD